MRIRICLVIVTFSMLVTLTACGGKSNTANVPENSKNTISTTSEIILEKLPEQTESLEEDVSFAQAYLDILLAHEVAIKEHRASNEKGQVALVDIDGDKIPELIYFQGGSDELVTELYIWTYQDEMAKLIFSDDEFYVEAGGGMDCAVVLLPDKGLCTYRAGYNEYGLFEFAVYNLSSGTLVKKESFQYEHEPSYDYQSTIERYLHNEVIVDKTEYDALVREVTAPGCVVLALYFSRPNYYWQETFATKTCNEAITHLQQISGKSLFDFSQNEHAKYYKPVLEKFRDYVTDEDFSGSDEQPWEYMHEFLSYSKNPRSDFGYTFYDINGNGFPELILFAAKSDYICAIYSLVDYSPYLLSGFWPRYSCIILEDGTLNIRGSGGHADFSKTTCTIAQDGKSFIQIDKVGMESYDEEIGETLDVPHRYTIDSNGTKKIITDDEFYTIWDVSKIELDLPFTPLW